MRVAGTPTSALKAFPGEQVEDAYARVSRLFYGEEAIGTAVRLESCIILTCRHCVVEDGRCLENLTAFNGPLQFVGAQPNLDVAVFKGPEGHAFGLAAADVQVGRVVQLLSYP